MKIKVLPRLLLFSEILFMNPTAEKIIIAEDKTLKIPTIAPITGPLSDIEFRKVLTKEYKVKEADPKVVTVAAAVPVKKSLPSPASKKLNTSKPRRGQIIKPKVIHKSP